MPAGTSLFQHSGLVLRLQADAMIKHHAELSAKFPAAAELLQIGSVSEVLFGHDRVTVNLEPGHVHKWDQLSGEISGIVSRAVKQPISQADLECLASLTGTTNEALDAAWEDGSVESEIVEVLESHIRPYIREDGGDLRFIGFDHERGTARVHLVGACSGCPSSAKTLQGRVEQLLKHFIPEVQSVEPVSEAEAATVAANSSTAAPGLGHEKVNLQEHMRRLLAEGEATSVVWEDAQRRPLAR